MIEKVITRKEQIQLAANDQIGVELIPFKRYFVLGAEWADRHIRNGLVDIEKACEWLVKHTDLSHLQFEDFKKAMQEDVNRRQMVVFASDEKIKTKK